MQDQVLTSWPVGRPGMAHSIGPKEDVPMLNYSPAAKAVKTLVVDTAVGSLTTYAWTLLSVAQSVATASADKAVIAGLIKDEIINDPLTGGWFESVVSDGVDKLTLTYIKPGVDFAFTDSDANLTIATVTAAASADTVPFGSVLVRDSGDLTDFNLASLPSVLGKLSYDLTPVAANDAVYKVRVKWDGLWYTSTIVADASATAAEIVTALAAEINGKLPTFSVLAVDNTTKLTLTAEIPGMPFEVEAEGSTAAADIAIARADTDGDFADIDKVIAGLALEDQRVAGDVGTTELEYAAQSSMTVRRKGVACVRSLNAAVTVGAAVWVGVTATNYGKVRTTKSSGDFAKCNVLQWRGRAGTYGGVNQGWLEVKQAA